MAQLAGLVDFIAAQPEGVGVHNTLAPVLVSPHPGNLTALLRAVILIRQQTCLGTIRYLHPKVLQQITDAGVTLIVAELTVARREVGGGGPYVRI
jgi:hypothetical protein